MVQHSVRLLMFPRGRAVGIETDVFPLSLGLYSLYFSIPTFLSYISLSFLSASPSLSLFASLYQSLLSIDVFLSLSFQEQYPDVTGSKRIVIETGPLWKVTS